MKKPNISNLSNMHTIKKSVFAISEAKFQFILLLSIIIFTPLFTFAQNDCSTSLKESVEKFDQGLYQQVLEVLLERVNTCNYSKSEKEQAQKLIIASYFELDELEKGTQATYKFLKKDPNYTINSSTDPIMFMNELQSFNVQPRFKVSLNVGFNKLVPKILTINTIWELADYSAPYILVFKPNFNLGIEWFAYKNFSLKSGVNYLFHSYEREITAPTDFVLNYNETYSEIKIPIELKYTFNYIKKWSPVIIGGIYYSKLINPLANIKITYLNSQTAELIEKPKNGITTANYRNLGNFGYYGGLALNYSINKFTYSIESVYSTDFKNFGVNTYNITNYEPSIDYYYIDDIFKLRNFQFSMGVAYTFSYQIRKKY